MDTRKRYAEDAEGNAGRRCVRLPRTNNNPSYSRSEGIPMLSTLPTVDAGAWTSSVSELDLEKKLAVQVIYSLRVPIFSC